MQENVAGVTRQYGRGAGYPPPTMAHQPPEFYENSDFQRRWIPGPWLDGAL